MQWAAIFHKCDVRFVSGIEELRFYNSELDRPERVLPCKVSCARCGTLIADEGRRMWLAFPTLFDFGSPPDVPAAGLGSGRVRSVASRCSGLRAADRLPRHGRAQGGGLGPADGTA